MDDLFKIDSISFSTFMLLDYSESIYIEISTDEKEGYTTISQFDLFQKLSKNFKHMNLIFNKYFDEIIGLKHGIETYFKRNNSKIIWIKCYKTWWSGFEIPYKEHYEYFEIDDAIKYVIDKNLNINPPCKY